MFNRLIVLAAALVSVAANAATPPVLTVEYSANRRIESADGVFEGSIAAAPGMERSETRVGQMSTVMILRTDRKTGFMLMPAQKMYQELSLAQAELQSAAVSQEMAEFEAVGTETVAGFATTRYKFVAKDRSAGGFLWFSAEGIPVKMDVVSKQGRKNARITVTLDDIRVGAQDRTLFEVPAGYTRMPGGKLFGLAR